MSDARQDVSPNRRRSTGPVGRVLDVLSSVPLGIAILALLFVYMAVGSAGILVPVIEDGGLTLRHVMVRQMPAFELTEYEWFHTTTFLVLCIALCVSLTVTTIRRIPFNVMKLGPWMIHSGIIVLTLGSAWYFATKYEGDAYIIRRDIVINAGDQEVRMPSLPGNRAVVSTADGTWTFEVASIDPSWPILSGDDEGKEVYSVSVQITPPAGAPYSSPFLRQLLDGHPQYTEDLVRTDDQTQPFQRVAKLESFGGAKLVLPQDQLFLGLAPRPTDSFALKDTTAVYIRPVGIERWSMVGLPDKLPRYNDWVSDPSGLWPSPEVAEASERPLRVPVDLLDAQTDGPVTGAEAFVTGFLRYAVMEERFEDAGPAAELNPVLTISIARSDGRVTQHPLAAFDASRRSIAAGLVSFVWAEDRSVYDAVLAQAEAVRPPIVFVAGPGVPEQFDGLAMLLETGDASPDQRNVAIGQTISMGEGFGITVGSLIERATLTQLPRIVPERQRDPDADRARLYSMIELTVRTADGDEDTAWLHYHAYPYATDAVSDLALSLYRPGEVTLGDRTLEAMYSRESRPLPAPVVLDDFVLTTHVGGFTGTVASIRDWTSIVSFADADTEAISTNDPAEHAGLWFFQSFWDAPREGSAGMSFTGLGVTNREGVNTMLAGSCLTVLGLIYAFYVKPVIARRRVNKALARARSEQTEAAAATEHSKTQQLEEVNA